MSTIILLLLLLVMLSNARLRRRVSALEERFAEMMPTRTLAPAASNDAPVPGGDAAAPPVRTPPVRARADQSRAAGFFRGSLRRLAAWAARNWFYAAAAACLALAGVFLVIYGAERGLLPPAARVVAAMLMGAVLVGSGERIRHRCGGEGGIGAGHLPSVLSGAGVVTLFGSVLAARHLYGFIGPELALLGLAAVAALAVMLGWLNDHLLAGVGIIGAVIAPFLIGGAPEDPSGILIYLAIVTIVGLTIDTMRRWGWVSALSLTLGFASGLILMIAPESPVAHHIMAYCAALALAAIAIPARSWSPDHGGAPLLLRVLAPTERGPGPEFPTILAGGSTIAASSLILLVGTAGAGAALGGAMTLTLLALALLVWARNAPALTDLWAVPTVALAALTASGGAHHDLPPLMITGAGLMISLAAAWRSLRGGPGRTPLAAGAALTAPALIALMVAFWRPALTMSDGAWALHAMAVAALMVWAAERFARTDGPDDRLRASLASLSALGSLTLAVSLVIAQEAALTIALGASVLAATWLDRRFDLPLMGFHVLAGVSIVGYRLVADPGIEWALAAPLPELLLSHGGAVATFGLSWSVTAPAGRERSRILLESAALCSLGVLCSLLLHRGISWWASGEGAVRSHWALGLAAAVWIMLGAAQLHRMRIGGTLVVARAAMGVILLSCGALLALAAILANPLWGGVEGRIIGPAVLNTLAPAYLLPAALLLAAARLLRHLPLRVRSGFAAAGAGLAALWLGLAIRHAWRGAEGMTLPGMGQGELYTYTAALLIVGAALFYRSLTRGGAALRRAGLIVLGLAALKALVVDTGELDGLTRVFSLLCIGLTLAGLAWLDRWASPPDRSGPSGEERAG